MNKMKGKMADYNEPGRKYVRPVRKMFSFNFDNNFHENKAQNKSYI